MNRSASVKKGKGRRGLALFPKIALSFLLFAIAIIIAFTSSLIFTGIFATGNNLMRLTPEKLVDETGELIDLTFVHRIGGWVEKLDSSYHVTEVYGEKLTSDRVYDTKALLEMTNPFQEEGRPYHAFIYPYEDESGSGSYLLFYDRNNVSITSQLDISNANTNASWGRMFLLIFGSMFVIISLAMSYYLVRQIKRPLEALRGGMQKVEAGEQEVHLDFKASADLIELRDSFNRMTRELETQKREKAQMEEKKQRLLLELSHDLRTPVATIKSFAVALSEDLVPEKQKNHYYSVIADKADRVTTLASDLFSMLRMEDAQSPIHLEKLALHEFLRRLAASYYSEIERSHLHLDLQLPDAPLYIEADPSLLIRALGNLLENAIKYNKTGSRIVLSAEADEKAVYIHVKDDGESIPEEERDTLFDPFMRVDKVRTSSEGSGLGLAIANAIAQKHGGSLRYLQSEGFNHFTMAFPTIAS